MIVAQPVRWLAAALACAALLAVPARAQTGRAAGADVAPRGTAFEAALARKKDAETLLALNADGKALYDRDAVKLDGFAYCGQSLALAEQGEFRQSIRAASKALYLGRRDSNGAMQANALRNLAIAYSYAGVLDKAEDRAREALAIAGNDPVQVSAPALKVLGDVATRRERFAEATEHYRESLALASDRYRPLVMISLANAQTAAKQPREALALLERVAEPERRQAFFLRSRGNASLAAGDLANAATDFSAVTGNAASPDADYQRLWSYEGLARVKQVQGDDRGALEDYRRAVALVNTMRPRFRSDEFKAGLFGDVQRIFDAAIALSVAQQDFVAAWELSEASRTRELLDTVRSRATDTLSRQLSLGDVQRVLESDDAVLQYHAIGNAMIVWVIRPDSIRGRTLPLREADLAIRVEDFRTSFINDQRSDARALGRDLYETLVAPAELGAVRRVFLVPHGPLHYLPFQALFTGSGYLIEQYALSVWPSASVGVQMRNRSAGGGASLLAFGNPTTEERPLPAAEREVQQLSSLFPRHSIYLQHEATKTRFKELANSAALLHVATHAAVDTADPLFSRILFSSSGNDTGVLEAREVFRLDLGAVRLVTLSACDSGLGKISRGEEIIGFTRSFLSAGANSVIASLWPANDDSTLALMVRLYQELVAGRDLARAMQAAQIEVQRNPRFAHPHFWAPFYVIGNGQLKLAP